MTEDTSTQEIHMDEGLDEESLLQGSHVDGCIVLCRNPQERGKWQCTYISMWKTMVIYSHIYLFLWHVWVHRDTERSPLLCKLLFWKWRQRLAAESVNILNNFISSIKQLWDEFWNNLTCLHFLIKPWSEIKASKSLQDITTIFCKLWQTSHSTLP